MIIFGGHIIPNMIRLLFIRTADNLKLKLRSSGCETVFSNCATVFSNCETVFSNFVRRCPNGSLEVA